MKNDQSPVHVGAPVDRGENYYPLIHRHENDCKWRESAPCVIRTHGLQVRSPFSKEKENSQRDRRLALTSCLPLKNRFFPRRSHSLLFFSFFFIFPFLLANRWQTEKTGTDVLESQRTHRSVRRGDWPPASVRRCNIFFLALVQRRCVCVLLNR